MHRTARELNSGVFNLLMNWQCVSVTCSKAVLRAWLRVPETFARQDCNGDRDSQKRVFGILCLLLISSNCD